jgi:hypothetical protein
MLAGRGSLFLRDRHCRANGGAIEILIADEHG